MTAWPTFHPSHIHRALARWASRQEGHLGGQTAGAPGTYLVAADVWRRDGDAWEHIWRSWPVDLGESVDAWAARTYPDQPLLSAHDTGLWGFAALQSDGTSACLGPSDVSQWPIPTSAAFGADCMSLQAARDAFATLIAIAAQASDLDVVESVITRTPSRSALAQAVVATRSGVVTRRTVVGDYAIRLAVTKRPSGALRDPTPWRYRVALLHRPVRQDGMWVTPNWRGPVVHPFQPGAETEAEFTIHAGEMPGSRVVSHAAMRALRLTAATPQIDKARPMSWQVTGTRYNIVVEPQGAGA